MATPRPLSRRLAKSAARIALMVAAVLGAFFAWVYFSVVYMPGSSFSGPFEPLSGRERAVEAELRRDVAALAGELGDRSTSAGLAATADYIARAFAAAGYRVERQRFDLASGPRENIQAEIGGTSEAGIVVFGAHYDAVPSCAGADDNASGVAAMLSLARAFAGGHPARTLRFVAFANEEPPYFQTPSMGSVVYAKRCRERNEAITAMLSLETLGYFTDRPGSQRSPPVLAWFYPSAGDFITFVGDSSSRALVRRTVGAFRRNARFPSEGVAAPRSLPEIGWSDHWAFWQEGYPAVMVTDTAPLRYAHYHELTDTPDKLAYPAMARVVVGLERVVEELTGP